MRYGIISDIHGNLEAFTEVLSALSKERIDEYLSIGDVVGYGADPKECIRLLKSIQPTILIAGNHEWGVLGLKEPDFFTSLARRAVEWTKAVLNDEELEYLRSFKLVHEETNMTLVHGTLNSPEEFYYSFDTDDAYVTISLMNNPLCFIGHTHMSAIFATTDDKVIYIEENEVRIDPEKKYVINVGSIGQPRDGDNRASFAVYDDEEQIVEIKRVRYDIKKAQEKILSAGLPARLADRLSEGR